METLIPPPSPAPSSESSHADLALLFLRLGTTAFGGPAAHIAIMHTEIVARRAWLTETEFLDLLAAANLIPGPSSTELAIYIGYRRAGWIGLLLAGICFILPAAILCCIFAELYLRFGQLNSAIQILQGIKPVVIAIICQALFKLSRTAAKTPLLIAVALAAAIINFLVGHVLLTMLAAGLFVLLWKIPKRSLLLAPPLLAQTASATTLAASPSLLAIFGFFLKIGAILFGSGYVLLAFLQADLVDHLHWLTQRQLIDAVAVGQFTPGPVFTTATFLGYLLGGLPAASVATVGIFLPAFLFVAVSSPLLPHVRKSRSVAAFMDGLNAGAIALIAVVALQLGHSALIDPVTWTLFAAAILVLILFPKINSAWLILAGAFIGTIQFLLPR